MFKFRLLFTLLISFVSLEILFAQNIVINEIMSSNSTVFQDENGQYPDWVELYNNSNSAVNLNGYGISDKTSDPFKWTFPSGTLDAHKFLLICCDGNDVKTDFNHLHTNFSIKASGETVTLTAPDSSTVDQLDAISLQSDVSFGRQPDGGTNWYIFANGNPTPGATNNNSTGISGIADSPIFSLIGGLYKNALTISLSTTSGTSKIYYTLNGSIPTSKSLEYTSPININKTTVLRARAYEDGYLPSKTITNTYLINERNNLAVISISTDSSNFFDQNTGIYVTGPNGGTPNPDNPDTSANYWKDWEKPIHIEMYEPDGKQAFSEDAGVKIHGGYSREYPEKSLAIYSRGSYGSKSINYKIFPDLNLNELRFKLTQLWAGLDQHNV